MRIRCLVLSLACSFAVTAPASDTWPQWRGPGRDCRVSSAAWPDDLTASTLKEAYRVPLGPSYSGPVVSNTHVFVTESDESKGVEAVRALKRDTGEEVWKKEWRAGMKVPFFAASNGSWIRSTPAYADGRLFVASMEDIFVCLDAATGEVVWQKDFRKEFGTGNQSFGFVCSPLVHGDAVYVQAAAGLVKCDVASGKTLWLSLSESGGMMGGAFSSPVIATIGDQEQLVVQTRASLCGVALKDGDPLWSQKIPAFRGMNILTPTVIGNRVYTSSYQGGSFMFDVVASGGSFEVKEAWKAKAEAYMSSPVVVDDHIFLHLRNQRFTCLNAADGEEAWTTRPFGKYWSMVVNDSKALALDERGDLILINLTPDGYEEVSKTKVSEQPTWAHLAVCGNEVFVRSLDALIVYRWE